MTPFPLGEGVIDSPPTESCRGKITEPRHPIIEATPSSVEMLLQRRLTLSSQQLSAELE